jgi:hypothetical protein
MASTHLHGGTSSIGLPASHPRTAKSKGISDQDYYVQPVTKQALSPLTLLGSHGIQESNNFRL